jgi:hypothetical protein
MLKNKIAFSAAAVVLTFGLVLPAACSIPLGSSWNTSRMEGFRSSFFPGRAAFTNTNGSVRIGVFAAIPEAGFRSARLFPASTNTGVLVSTNSNGTVIASLSALTNLQKTGSVVFQGFSLSGGYFVNGTVALNLTAVTNLPKPANIISWDGTLAMSNTNTNAVVYDVQYNYTVARTNSGNGWRNFRVSSGTITVNGTNYSVTNAFVPFFQGVGGHRHGGRWKGGYRP